MRYAIINDESNKVISFYETDNLITYGDIIELDTIKYKVSGSRFILGTTYVDAYFVSELNNL